MSSVAVPRGGVAWSGTGASARALTGIGLAGLAGLSLALRARALPARLWMDEGIAVGIASHPISAIPGLLRLDGSPPLYYLLLHGWMALAGASEVAVHWLSLLLAILCVPVAWWVGASAVDRRAGWALAVLVACCPFLTSYASDARMYSLVILLALACVGCFLNAYVRRRRAYAAPFGVSLALLAYTHDWGLLLGAGLGLGFVLVAVREGGRRRRESLRAGALGFGLAALLFLPWLPTLLFQAAHTGAPWATAPGVGDLVRAPADLLGGVVAAAVALGVAAAGWVVRGRDRRVPVGLLLLVATVPVLLGWALSQLSPAWDVRYLAVVLAPAVAAVAIGLVAAGRWGVLAVAVLVALWAPRGGPVAGSDAAALGAGARPLLRSGDLVVSTPIGQVPLLAYYLPRDLRFASPFGLQRDPRVVDWRDAARHLARTSTGEQLRPLLERLAVGGRVLLVEPVRWDARSRRTALGRRLRRRSAQYVRALRGDPRFRLVAVVPAGRLPADGLRGLLFRKRAAAP